MIKNSNERGVKMKTKLELRTYGKEVLKKMSEEEKKEKEQEIYLALLNSQLWEKASTIGCTIAQAHEVETAPIIELAWQEGKKVVVPKCTPKESHLDFHELSSFDQLETVYFGLQEPVPTLCPVYEPNSIDLMLVPGLIFDLNGYRIGYGGGYYDRYLATYANQTVALATEAQLVESVPFEEYDVPVNHIVTEKGFRL